MAFLARTWMKSARPMWAVMNTASRRQMSSHRKETDEEFDSRWKAYFDRPNIDGNPLNRSEELNENIDEFRLGHSSRHQSHESIGFDS